MAEVVVRLPGPLREFADGAREVAVTVDEAALGAVLAALAARHPGVVARTLDERGALRRHMNVFVGADNVRDLDGLATPVPAGAVVSIIPAISGGSLDHAAVVEREAAAVLAALGRDPAAPVPGCPGWDVLALVGHLGGGYARVARIVRGGPVEPPPWAAPDPGADPAGWFAAATADLVAALRETPADATAWHWRGEPVTAGWWARRIAHETAVHRWDAETATGTRTPADPYRAADGVDELLTVHLAARRPATDATATAHVHCTDVPGEWLVAFGPDAVTVTREHAKGDAAVRGTAAEVELALWGRLPFDELETFGDRAVLDRLRSG